MWIYSLQIALFVLTLVGAIGVWRHPRYFLPVLIFALPIDISSTWFSDLAWLNKLGSYIGVITFARIFSFALIAYYFISLIRDWRKSNSWEGAYNVDVFLQERPVWKTSLFMIMIGYLGFGLLSSVWSVNPLQSIVQSIRLSVLLFLGFAAYSQIKRERSPWLIPQAFSLVSTLIGLIGIFEMLTNTFLWNGEVYRAAGRINATFVDANIYARFLVIGILATLIWMIARQKSWGNLLGLLSLMIQLTALVGTGSRTGWACAVFALVGLTLLVPRKQIFLVLGGGLAAGLLALAIHPEFIVRLMDLKKGLAVAALERQYLVQAGWDMFIHHPVYGVGLNGFQTMMFTQYPDLIKNEISLSHTALLTTAAELGIIGVLGVVLFLVMTYRELFLSWSKRKISAGISGFPGNWLLTVFAVLSITIIFISAQGEGRFFEDPALWIFAGLLMALPKVEEV